MGIMENLVFPKIVAKSKLSRRQRKKGKSTEGKGAVFKTTTTLEDSREKRRGGGGVQGGIRLFGKTAQDMP